MARPRKKLKPERAPGICEGLPQSEGEVMGSQGSCDSEEEQVEGRNGKVEEGESSEMGGEKAMEMETKEEGIEGKDKQSEDLEAQAEDEGVALKKPNKRGRKKKQVAASLERGKEEVLEEGNVKGGTDLVAEENEENGLQPKGNKRVISAENPEIENGEDGARMKEEADLGDNGQGNGGESLKRRLRAVVKKVSYAEILGDEDEGFLEKKQRRKRGRKKVVLKSEGQEDANNENEDNAVSAKKRGRRGRPPKGKVSESENNEGKDVKEEGGKEEKGGDLGLDAGKRRTRRGAKKMDKEVLGNGKSLGKHEENESLEEPVPLSKKRKDAQWIAEVSLMCHQCQRNDKGRVVRCKLCKRKRY